MRRKAIPAAWVAVSAMLLLTGWGKNKGTLDYGMPEPYGPEETALIRPAGKEEMREGKPNLAKRLFLTGAGSEAKLMAISTGNGSDVKLADYDAVRTLPGLHNLNVRCTRGGFHVHFVGSLLVVAGGEYLFECVGSTAHTVRLMVTEKNSKLPVSNEADLRATQWPVESSE